MQEWKIKQNIYHRLHTEHDDDLSQVDIVISNAIEKDALRHFNERIDEWIYPSKSYFVAICYAHWISVDFNEDFIDLLNDPDLLAGNDPYFVTYKEDPDTYDYILKNVSFPIKMEGMVSDVKHYYNLEILY